MPNAKSPKRVARKTARSASGKKPAHKRVAARKTTAGAAATHGGAASGIGAPDKSATTAEARRPKAPRTKGTSGPTITIEQYVSGIACPVRQKRVLRSLGLRHPWHRVVRPDNPAVRGMVKTIPHLVRIVVEETRRGA